jgi:hypothetical protein
VVELPVTLPLPLEALVDPLLLLVELPPPVPEAEAVPEPEALVPDPWVVLGSKASSSSSLLQPMNAVRPNSAIAPTKRIRLTM